MKRILTAVVFFAGLAAAVFWTGPTIVERRINRVRRHATWIPQRVERLHRSLLIADLHADSLLWNRGLLEESGRGQVDVPRLIEGNVALQAFTVVTKAPRGLNMVRNDDTSDLVLPLILLERWPSQTWSSYKERALYQARQFGQAVATSKRQLVWIKSAADLNAYLERRRHEPLIVAGLLGIEGAQALDGNLANMPDLIDAGFRMMSPTHFTDNPFGGSATGTTRRGLTPAGRALIKEMEAHHMIIDLAHASPETIDDVLAIATQPVLISHTGVRATCDSNRNLTDDQIKAIARTGGLVGIAYFEAAVCGTNPGAIVRAIRHVTDIVGVDHVALGSDFDGGVRMPFDTSDLVLITEALLSGGFVDTEIAKIMGGNTLTFLAKNLL